MASLITLDIDDEVLLAAEAIAMRENRDIGDVVSALVRTALNRETAAETNVDRP